VLLRQACCAFDLYIGVLRVSLLVGVLGAGLLLFGKTTEGAATAAGSGLVGVASQQLAQRTRETIVTLADNADD